ncbi:MAG: calcium/sodium antiporter [Opitutales bacterium]
MHPVLIDSLTGLASLALLFSGAELLVRAAVDIGLRLKLSPLIVGLTIVAFATSAPELVVSVQAALKGTGAIALGNVFGSNLANLGLILGLSAMITPMAVDRFSVRVDGPVMFGVSLLAGWFAWSGEVARWQGFVLFALLMGYLVFRIRLARRHAAAEVPVEGVPDQPRWSWAVAIMMLLAGLGLLVAGGDLLVRAGSSLAATLGMPQSFIALTLVAVGTSLPELATSLVAAARKQADIAVGNVLGSNIFNVTCVLGLSALTTPLKGDPLGFEIGAMLVISLGVLPLLRTGHRVERWEGALLLLAYLGVIALAA